MKNPNSHGGRKSNGPKSKKGPLTKADQDENGKMSRYKPEFAAQLPDLMAHGEAAVEVMAHFGITKPTFYQWLEKYPEFREAYDLARVKSEAWWTQLGRKGASCEVAIQPGVWLMNMKNRFKWKDRHDVTSDDAPLTPVTGITIKTVHSTVDVDGA